MFQALSDTLGLPVDQIRYITLLFLSYPLAYVFRYALHPSHTSLITRHIFSLSFGLLFGFLCFGTQMFIVFAIVGVCYAMLKYLPATAVQWYTMVWAMGCMSAAHIYRMMTDYGGWTLDFTGPLMLIVQKVTMIAFALHDGKGRSDSSFNEDQREQKIDVCPSPLEYSTYIFNFHSFLAGPTCTIKDFLAFMDGSNLKTKEHVGEPSAAFAIFSKLSLSLFSMVAFLYLGMYFTQDMTIDPQYSIPSRTYIILFYGYVFRLKYYFVWYMVDSVNNLCGLGFNGYDERGQPKWDLIKIVDMRGVELPSNPRSISSSWNITTSKWLRRVCYERVPFSPTMTTFALSALWHGFYPGYYLTYVYVAIVTDVARKLRRLVRPHFQSSLPLKWSYDVMTIVLSRFSLEFAVIPLDMLWLHKGILLWSYFYFIPQVTLVLLMLLLPSGKQTDKKTKVH